MWYKYLISSTQRRDQQEIGLKVEDTKMVGMIGGQKRLASVMEKIVENFFLVPKESIEITFPQTYKVKMKFAITEESLEYFKSAMIQDVDYYFMAVDKLDRVMR